MRHGGRPARSCAASSPACARPLRDGTPGSSPTGSPTAITPMPSHAPAEGGGAPRANPHSAVLGPATPAVSPATPAPARRTQVNRSTKAAAVPSRPGYPHREQDVGVGEPGRVGTLDGGREHQEDGGGDAAGRRRVAPGAQAPDDAGRRTV